MRKKVIFLDIDGTLTEPGCNEPPASAVEAIQKARANGHYVFLCSGRSYAMLEQLLKYGFDGVIASAGGDIRIGERVIYDCPMEMELAKEALAVLRKTACTARSNVQVAPIKTWDLTRFWRSMPEKVQTVRCCAGVGRWSVS